MQGSVFTIESLSALDGPGLRSVVFLNGCYLRCGYCHNPEMFSKKNNNIAATELAEKILRNKAYFSSGGGVTFSGGEALLQVPFLIEVVKILKENDIHVAIDTSGVTDCDYSELLSLVDLLLFDVKHTTEKEYQEITGASMSSVKEFKKFLSINKTPLWIRQVIVPGIHDNEEYLLSLKDYIKDLNVQKVCFLPYSDLAKDKYVSLNMEYKYKDVPSMDKTVCDELLSMFNKL
ncbi:MAG: radical SAM protein [bacterium]